MTTELRTIDGGSVALAPEALQAFRAGLRGELLAPDAPDYEEQRRLWNGMIDRRPALIARCTGTADVAHAVRFAAAHRLLTSVRSGGHNIGGLAMCEGGLVIDLSPLKGVWVDPARRLARAQAGCTLADVDRETQLHGLAAPLGFVSTTGIAGLTVGGGFGYLTRRVGWTCDNVVSMEVVDARGAVHRAAADENQDLFWALRGGGGNFGIVTSFEYRLTPLGPQIFGGAVAWPLAQAGAVLAFFREFAAAAPRELTLVAVLRLAPPAPWLPQALHGKPVVVVFACHTGLPEEGEALLAPLRAFGTPAADVLIRRPYTQMQSLLDATQPKGRRYYWKSHYLPALAPELLARLAAELPAIPSPHSGLILFQIEGALAELPALHSPAGNRDAAWVLNIAGSWERPEDDAANVAWARAVFEATRACSTGGVYVNFLTEEEGRDRIEAAYGEPILERLAALKRRFDPEDLFRHTKRVTA